MAGQQEGGEGDMHAVIDMESWQLLHLAWIHRTADVCKAGAEEEPREEWRFGIGSHLGGKNERVLGSHY